MLPLGNFDAHFMLSFPKIYDLPIFLFDHKIDAEGLYDRHLSSENISEGRFFLEKRSWSMDWSKDCLYGATIFLKIALKKLEEKI